MVVTRHIRWLYKYMLARWLHSPEERGLWSHNANHNKRHFGSTASPVRARTMEPASKCGKYLPHWRSSFSAGRLQLRPQGYVQFVPTLFRWLHSSARGRTVEPDCTQWNLLTATPALWLHSLACEGSDYGASA
ncbi:MAG: hypothetical protein UX39_C0022G0006 [Candidatus Magasanikbacteria bacterium GW2011_GWA2_46_17]|uniref:Uncharacterized protein n=1 Tax=Candidatus Magasanikbacteria bacterium GW2011_GWA2_46_17 TaxID=1619042 RepID=A0A0G1RXT9_9BACT|nr:MAG: hypothetical protein UX39_C0022G0006 [Candidatus Magasanikbacteria bacterium GW2011_GWA2_46_17]